MQNLDLITLEERPDMLLQAAGWFHSKWGVPIEEYRNSMEECLKDSIKIPRWYFVLNDVNASDKMKENAEKKM